MVTLLGLVKLTINQGIKGLQAKKNIHCNVY